MKKLLFIFIIFMVSLPLFAARPENPKFKKRVWKKQYTKRQQGPKYSAQDFRISNPNDRYRRPAYYQNTIPTTENYAVWDLGMGM